LIDLLCAIIKYTVLDDFCRCDYVCVVIVAIDCSCVQLYD